MDSKALGMKNHCDYYPPHAHLDHILAAGEIKEGKQVHLSIYIKR